MIFIINYWDYVNLRKKEIFSSGWGSIVSDFENLTGLPHNIIVTIEVKPLDES